MYTTPLQLMLVTALAIALSACGSNGDRVANTTDTPVNDNYTPPVIDNSNAGFAGGDVLAKNSQFVALTADINSSNATFQWQQVSGPQAIILDNTSRTLQLLTPSMVNNNDQMTFELSVNDNGVEQQDQVTIHLSRCQAGQDVIFSDCIAPGYGALTAYIQENTPGAFRDGVHFDGQSDKHITWQMVDIGGSHGSVIEVHFGANDPLNTLQHNGWFGITAANAAGEPLTNTTNLSQYAGGAIQFDIRQLDSSPAITGIGQECVWPCTGAHKFWAPTREWQTITIAIEDFASSGIDLATVNIPFMFREPWMSQDAHSFQLDNIRLLTDYTKPMVAVEEPPAPAELPPAIELLGNPEVGLGISNSVSLTSDAFSSGIFVEFSYGTSGHWLSSLFLSEPDENNNRMAIPRDLSDYFYGTLSLHFTVEDWQDDAHERLLLTANCGPGCQTFPPFQSEALPVGSAWVIDIPIKEMVERGLDLSNVTEIFSIKPQDGTSTRAAFQLHSATLWPN